MIGLVGLWWIFRCWVRVRLDWSAWQQQIETKNKFKFKNLLQHTCEYPITACLLTYYYLRMWRGNAFGRTFVSVGNL